MVRKLSCIGALVLFTGHYLLSGAARATTPEALAELGRRWAEERDFSGSVRLQKNGELLPSINRGTVVGSDTPVDDATVFWIGSLSKQFAAAAILLLTERGELALGDPVTKHLPELRADVLTKDGVVCSIEHVLSHTCGLPRDIGFDQLHTARHLAQPTRAERLFAQVNGAALGFVPGTGYLYSNVGYDLMGLVIQRLAGLPYEKFLRDEFWQPLGMTHTGIQLRPGIVPMRGQMSAGLTWLTAATWLLFDPDTPSLLGASGNIYSTPTDLLRWNHALHHGRILKPASYQSMITPRSKNYGLGVSISDKPFGKAINHLGSHSPQSTSAILVYVPEHDIGLAGAANRSITASGLKELADGLVAEAAGMPATAPKAPGLLVRVADSALLLAMAFVVVTVAATLWRCFWRREQSNRLKWWLNYHTAGLLFGVFMLRWRESATEPALIAWGAVLLVGSYGGRWWALPEWKAGARPRKAYLDLAGQVAALLGLLYFSTNAVRWVFGAVCVLQALAVAGSWLRERSTSSKRRTAAES